MRIRQYSAAVAEIAKAAEYFENQQQGLGFRFLDEIERTIKEIAASPMSWPTTNHGTRKRNLISPFPFTIHYKVIGQEIAIIAVGHQRRDPEYWIGRIG